MLQGLPSSGSATVSELWDSNSTPAPGKLLTADTALHYLGQSLLFPLVVESTVIVTHQGLLNVAPAHLGFYNKMPQFE
jgi:hypothetical protein